jgi:hypothetical protein
MTRHEAFLTEEFLQYAAECQRMAAFARPLQGKARADAPTVATRSGWISPMAARYGQPRATTLGWNTRPAYA